MKNASAIAIATIIAVCFILLANKSHSDTVATDYAKILTDIKSDLADLAGEYPQLQDVSEKALLNASRLSLAYSYRTHVAQQPGGWTAGVPNPDDDGIWFYIDFHDPNSSEQIHTQPVIRALCLGPKQVSVLILEGKNTKSASGKIYSVLRNHGVTDCRDIEKLLAERNNTD